MFPCTTTSAPRIATPAIAPAFPRTTTEPPVHVVGETPADVPLDLDPRAVGEPGAEVARRSVDAQRDRARQPDADVMARVGVDDIDVLPLLAVCPEQAVRLRDGDRR